MPASRPPLWTWRQSSRGRALVVFLSLAVLVVGLFPRVVFLGQVLFERDIHVQSVAQARSFVRAISTGSWPVWNPYWSFGQPLLANPNTQVLYPPTWLLLVLEPAIYYTLYVLAHTLFLGVGTYALGRRLGFSTVGAWLSAAAWMLSGPVVSLANIWNHLAGAAWIPWVLLAAQVSFTSQRLAHGVLWGAALAAQVLVGSPEMSMIALFLSAALLLARLPREPGEIRGVLRVAATAAATGACLSAGQWLPFLALARDSVRTLLSPGLSSFWSVHQGLLVETLVPVLFYRLPLTSELLGRLYDGREPLIRSLYLGLPALGFVAAAVASASRRTLATLLLASAALLVLLALGPHTPFYGWATAALPPLRALRFPSKAMVGVSLCWALLVGLGFEALRAAPPRTRRVVAALTLLGGVVVCGLALVAGLGAESVGRALLDNTPAYLADIRAGGTDLAVTSSRPSLTEVLSPVALGLARTGVLAIGVGLLLWISRHPKATLVAVAALTASDLLLTHVGLHATTSSALMREPAPVVAHLLSAERTRVYAHDYAAGWSPAWGRSPRNLPFPPSWPPSVVRAAVLRSYAQPSIVAAWGVEGSYDRDLLQLSPRHLSALTESFYRAPDAAARLRLLQIGAVARVAALHQPGFELLEEMATAPALVDLPIRIYRVPGALARTYAVGRARVVEDTAVQSALLDPQFDPHTEVLLAPGSPTSAAPDFTGSSRLLDFRADRITVAAELSRDGYVVLVDTYDPGWRAYVDGRETRVLRANSSFRAAAVPAGRHIVEFRYWPRALLAGLWLSAVGVVVAGAALVSVIRRPSAPPAQA